jgi:autotransporter-associated beta strand protein
VGFGDVNFNKGGTSGGVNLNLNGFSETINGLNSSGTGGITLRNSTSAAATATLTVGAADANGVYAGTIVNGHASALLNIAKIGAGTQELAGSNTYTGTTTVGAGKLLLSGTLTGTSLVTVNGGTFEYTNATAGLNRAVTANSGGTFRYNTTQAYTGALTMAGGSVAGSGNLGATVLGGTGSVDPGNSPGILTAAVFNGSGGLGANFEFTEVGDPDWDITDASVNDVLRLTQTTGDGPFDAVNLTGSNSIGIYLNVATLAEGDSFKGGFFTDQSADFLTSIAGANYAYFVMGDGLGTDVTYNSQGYYTLSNFDPLLLVNVGTAQIASADFAAGTVTNGYVSTFTVAVIPEPASLVLLLVSGIALLALRRRR